MPGQFHVTRILSTDGLDQNGIQVLEEAGFEVIQRRYSKTDLMKELVGFDVVIVRSATTIDGEIIRAVTAQKQCRLKVIARAGTGVDNIDVSAATENGLLVINTPAANTMSAAEHTCALMCCLSRQIPQAYMSMQKGLWERKLFMGTELMGKTLAIIGLGRIGKEVALRAQAFEMNTIGYDPLVSPEEASKFNVRWMELNDIWPLADYITVHVPLIPQTENLIDSNTFARCKRGVNIINCARGGIVSETDLLTALNDGSCGGAALDVFVDEPPTCTDLIIHPKLIATPHLGASTIEAQYRVSIEIAENIVALSTGSSLTGLVNGHSLALESVMEMQKWKKLLDRISDICKGLSEINLFYADNVGCCSNSAFESFVKNYLAMNMLSGTSNSINLINSACVAKESNLKISLQKIIRPNTSEQPRLILEMTGELIELSLLSGRLFLTGFGQTSLSQTVLLEKPGQLIISSNSKDAFEMLADYIESNDLISFSAQEDLSVFIFIVKKIKNHSFASIMLSIKF